MEMGKFAMSTYESIVSYIHYTTSHVLRQAATTIVLLVGGGDGNNDGGEKGGIQR